VRRPQGEARTSRCDANKREAGREEDVLGIKIREEKTFGGKSVDLKSFREIVDRTPTEIAAYASSPSSFTNMQGWIFRAAISSERPKTLLTIASERRLQPATGQSSAYAAASSQT
jgi:hypothetical protein